MKAVPLSLHSRLSRPSPSPSFSAGTTKRKNPRKPSRQLTPPPRMHRFLAGGDVVAADLAPPPALSLEDCVLLKLCLTCALCGRLLRRHPAAIETCGHCFCYDCINAAVEEGCVPLVKTWPWSSLSAEVAAATARWVAATEAASAPEHQAEPPSSASEKHDDADEVVVTAVTPTRQTPVPAADTRSPHAARKQRKLRQKCPLCLGPAFKWMLVSVPPVADLCTQLRSAYPNLEAMLQQLTEEAVVAERARKAQDTETEIPRTPERQQLHFSGVESLLGDDAMHQNSLPSDSATFVAAAFTPSSAASALIAKDGDSSSDDDSSSSSDEEDEEAERRRRRSSGGMRKEITFADKVATCVTEAPATPTLAVAVSPPPSGVSEDSLSMHSMPLEDLTQRSPHASAETMTTVGEDVVTAHAKPQDVSTSGSGILADASAFQLSMDLIPLPGSSCDAPTGKTTSDLKLDSQPLIPAGLLGQSPPVDEQRGVKDAEVQDDGETTPKATAKPALWTTILAAAANTSLSQTDLTTVSQLPYLAEPGDENARAHDNSSDDVHETPSSVPSGASDPAVLDVLQSAPEPTAAAVPIVTPDDGVVLLDTATLTAAPVNLDADEYAVVRDFTLPSATASTPPYSSVRASSVEWYESFPTDYHVYDQDQRGGWTKGYVGVAAASRHPRDVWGQSAAYLQRHPRLPSCYVALRTGQLIWCDDGGDSSAAKLHCNSSLACVAGSFAMPPSSSPFNELSEGETDGGGRTTSARKIFALSPAVCTAAVMGVPCVDISWFAPSDPCAERCLTADFCASFVTPFQSSVLPPSGETPDGAVEPMKTKRDNGLPSSDGGAPTQRQPGSWIRPTRQLLISCSPLSWHAPSSSQSDAPPQSGRKVYCFFVLPDGAVAHLVAAAHHLWRSLLTPQSGSNGGVADDAVGVSGGVDTPPPTSRKRSRDVDGCGAAWDITDGHPQRAWRRLLLATGGAVVEVSGPFYEAAVAAALEMTTMEGRHPAAGEPVPKATKEQKATKMAALLDQCGGHHAARCSRDDLWVHVDVGECSRDVPRRAASSPPSTVSVDSIKFSLFVLYAPALVRKAALPLGNEFVRFFYEVLDNLASLIAFAISLILTPKSSRAASPVAHEVRPAFWLLENIAQCRRSAGSYTSPAKSCAQQKKPAPPRHANGRGEAGKDASPQRVEYVVSSTSSLLEVDEPADSTESGSLAALLSNSAAPSVTHPETPPQRVGVYRNLLYSDTP